MALLSDRMREHYARWREDLPAGSRWQDFFRDCPDPNFNAIPANLEIDDNALIWPGRRDAILPGAPREAHVGRAFDGIEPENVRVVVLGQDPYPAIAEATGRAFEDGSWNAGIPPQALAKSLKPLMLAAWATQPDHAGMFRPGGWSQLVGRPKFAFPEPSAYFNALAGEGVLFVNSAWTRTGDEHLAAHRSLWKPVLDYLLKKLAKSDQPMIFLLLGGDAREAFCAADPVCNRSAIVDSGHPRSAEVFKRRNPLERVNLALGELGGAPVRWWSVPPHDAV
ncbi:hypothetical protein CEW88_23305 (plasmid) [Alloyangia pacifica]|uniref:Uracil-DNA glycosylase n=1 Tax=Alloyangia pacifica TaxID=311180 RepID=A0A2U8HLQ5_9RHOB|nr:uracil-DNA glycosylase family protein [Alloyangia pacifica]AWI86702.1 hypothetical protein CEW88_23305 [Alloyangia pacifica]